MIVYAIVDNLLSPRVPLDGYRQLVGVNTTATTVASIRVATNAVDDVGRAIEQYMPVWAERIEV